MTADQRRRWFGDTIAWFEALPIDVLDDEVPACPGWRVDDVLNHLTYGLGVGYALAVAAAPDADPAEIFAGISLPDNPPRGAAAREEFGRHMRSCLALFERTDPASPCWTYAGPGTASFWFRRAAVESWLHHVDVADAIDQEPIRLTTERAGDALEETISFSLPLAINLTSEPDSHLVLQSPALPARLELGSGDAATTISGTGHDVLLALWGRHRDRVAVEGDVASAEQWMSLAERAFAGPE